MKTQILSLTVALCLNIASGAQAQSEPQPPAAPQATRSLSAISGLYVPPPEFLARQAKVNQYNREGQAAFDKGKYDAMEADARKALFLDPYSETAQENLALALNAQGKEKEALQVYKHMADRGTDQGRDLLPYALLLLKTGQSAEAAAAYNKSLPHLPFSDLLSARGEISASQSQPKEIERDCHLALGLVYASYGVFGAGSRNDLALDQYERALQLSPDNALANYYKGDVLKRIGFKAQAHDAYAKAAKFGDGDVRKAAEDALAGR